MDATGSNSVKTPCAPEKPGIRHLPAPEPPIRAL